MATSAEKVSKYRELAKDKSLPQAVRDQYDTKATALEQKAYEETKAGKSVSNVPEGMKREGFAKGGVVAKAPVGLNKKATPAASKTPAVKTNVAVSKVSAPKVAPKKVMLAKGGSVAKKGCK
jgi:hypothetical protein